ncbi:MAG: hypothetical protein R3C15_19645 [Thermoleophilia bacterium]
MRSGIVVIAALASVSLALPGSILAGTALEPPKDTCWTRVVNDWTKDRKVAATYRIRCYTEAIKNGPADLLTFSTFEEDVLKARKRAMRTCVERLGSVAACGPEGNARTSPDYQCWTRVIDDWAKDRHVRPTHKVRCYSDALRYLPADLRRFTDVVPEIKRARETAIGRCERARGAGSDACRP